MSKKKFYLKYIKLSEDEDLAVRQHFEPIGQRVKRDRRLSHKPNRFQEEYSYFPKFKLEPTNDTMVDYTYSCGVNKGRVFHQVPIENLIPAQTRRKCQNLIPAQTKRKCQNLIPAQTKRKRGRPPKLIPAQTKRKRGRPPKVNILQNNSQVGQEIIGTKQNKVNYWNNLNIGKQELCKSRISSKNQIQQNILQRQIKQEPIESEDSHSSSEDNNSSSDISTDSINYNRLKKENLALKQKINELQDKLVDCETELKKIKLSHSKDVSEIKKKLWCFVCGKEASFYCCTTIAYCSENCRFVHWNQSHKITCQRLRN